jgi:hypothetical protein
VALVVVVAASSCGPKLPPLPSAGGPPWLELTSAHFQFFTDAPENEARTVVQEMEHVRSVIYGAVFPDAQADGHTVVIAMAGVRESSMFTPPDHSAFAVPPRGSPIGWPLMVLPIDERRTYEQRDDGLSENATHELAHALSYNAIHDQPRWFAEGLATYLQTIKIEPTGEVEVGRPPADVAHSLAQGMRPLWPIADVFACRAMACTDWLFYERAWALFAYMRNKHPHELAPDQEPRRRGR